MEGAIEAHKGGGMVNLHPFEDIEHKPSITEIIII